jgi:hypothetical protein
MADNWQGFHEGEWPTDQLSEHFTWHEVACRHCGKLPKNLDAVRNTAQMMEKVRHVLGGHPVFVFSWFRCPFYNAKVGGVANSVHLSGRAVDHIVKPIGARNEQKILKPFWKGNNLPVPEKFKALGKFLIGGFGKYATFTHLDNRQDGPSTWNG